MPSLSRTQENAITTVLGLQVGHQLIGLLNAPQAPTAPTVLALVNHTQPTYTAANDYAETIDGMGVTYLTVNAVKRFWEDTLTLAPKHSNALREKGITHPKDLAQFDSKEFNMVICSMKGRSAALPGLAQIRLRQACDFIQYTKATGRKMKDQYLTYNSIKSHAIQYRAFKDTDSKEVGGLPKLTDGTDVLSWLDSGEKQLHKLPSVDSSTLAYLLRENEIAKETSINFLPNKCYSSPYASIVGKLVARKSQRDICAETDRVTFYGYLLTALEDGPLESALQPHKETKDGQAVFQEILLLFLSTWYLWNKDAAP